MADASESSQPFSSSSTASEEDWARLMRAMGMHDAVVPGNGLSSAADLKVSANGSSTVTVEAGEALVGGFYYRNSTALTRSVPSNAGGSIARNDIVVIEADQVANDVTVKYLTGGSVSPTPVKNIAGKWQFLIAQLVVRAGATGVLTADVEDWRLLRCPGVLMAASGAAVVAESGLVLVTPAGIRYGTDSGFTTLDPVPHESWNPPSALINSFANRGGDYFNVGFTKLRDGTVRLRGWFRATTTNTSAKTLFTLPPTFRPSQQQSVAVPSSATGGISRIDVAAAGNVIVTWDMVNGDVGSLDGISFMAA